MNFFAKEILNKLFITCALMLPSFAWAGGSGSLFPPSINLAILLLFLYFKLKKPMHEYFKSNAKDIQVLIRDTEVKFKESEFKLKHIQGKLDAFASESEQIKNNLKEQFENSVQEMNVEFERKKKSLKEDINRMLEFEKERSLGGLKKVLLQEVFELTEKTLKGNDSLKNQVESNFLKALEQ